MTCEAYHWLAIVADTVTESHHRAATSYGMSDATLTRTPAGRINVGRDTENRGPAAGRCTSAASPGCA
ncbi:hypothetical protein FRAAL2815 [Frankia alni ACN14a]|uniref:Uncharacterized protein n=1 Tax=Frankia alni (strain DSM 45986 / CECT 9034 / ACN14a) TaxID=326424 RepID=Q0RLZ4_FRAAA|nr:hypothetical protein FRAAL2815 [Frankia alni ACN14a]